MSKCLFDVKWEVARDNLAIYSGALGNVIRKLEDTPGAEPGQIDAYRQELERVEHELDTMEPECPNLVNRANYIYVRMARYLMDEYLN